MKTFYKVFILAALLGFVYLFWKASLDKKEIDSHGHTTICKFTLCKQSSKSSSAFVKYSVNGKIYRNSPGGCPDRPQEKLGKFFVLKYLPADPNGIVVDFSDEVLDKALIAELEKELKFKI